MTCRPSSHIALRSQSGQMTVELATLIPVIVVVALIGYNVVRFAQACALFDRAAREAVVSLGSPSRRAEQCQCGAGGTWCHQDKPGFGQLRGGGQLPAGEGRDGR